MHGYQDTDSLDKDYIITQLQSDAKDVDLIQYLQRIPTVEVAEILSEIDNDYILDIFSCFDYEQQASIFVDLETEMQEYLFDTIDKRNFAAILEQMDSADRADFFQDLDKEEQIKLLPFFNKAIRDDIIHLSSYPSDTAGGIMSSDFATILSDMTVSEAIEKIRKDSPSKKMIYYCYVVDINMKLLGFITLKNLIMAEPTTIVSDIMHHEFVMTEVDQDRETVAQKIEKYDLVAIPVVNKNGQLLGIVSHDDAIEIIRAEHTEDFEKFMGITANTENFDYEEITVAKHFKKRFTWLAVLLLFGLGSGMVIQHFQYAIEKIVVLALFMPMIAATGGNVGSQAASVIIRAMALGQISSANWLKVLVKEARTSLLLGLSLGAVSFINVIIIASMSNLPEEINLKTIGMVVAFALSAQVMSAAMLGAVLPLLVKKFGGDPAVVASPVIASFVDITGLLIYFTITTAFFIL